MTISTRDSSRDSPASFRSRTSFNAHDYRLTGPAAPQLIALLEAVDPQQPLRKPISSTASTPLILETPPSVEWWRAEALEKRRELESKYSPDVAEQVRREINSAWYWKVEALVYWKQATVSRGKKRTRIIPWRIRESIDNITYWETELIHYNMRTGFILMQLGLGKRAMTERKPVSLKNGIKSAKRKTHDRRSKETAITGHLRRSSRIASRARP